MSIIQSERSSDPLVATTPKRWLGAAVRSVQTLVVTGIVASIAAFAAASPASANIVTIQQVSNNRYMDAHEIVAEDFRVVTRPAQNNDTQRWRMTHVEGNVYTFQQVSNNRYLDAHENAVNDFNVVTRPNQNNNTQRWLVTDLGGGIYHIQQVSSGRYLDAHEDATNDFRLVTRPFQNNATQQWRITVLIYELVPIFPLPLPPIAPVPPVHSSGTFQIGTPLAANLDNGQVALFGGLSGGDFSYFAPDLLNLSLNPTGGAELSFTNGAERGFAGCNAAAFSTSPVLVSALSPGDYVCARTNEGRISEFRLDGVGFLQQLTITYTTWQHP